MPEAEERWQRLIHGLRAGDEQVVREFCDQYGALVEKLADRNLPAGVRRRVGPDDIVQSVCRTFLRRARAGEFQLADSAALWRVLCAITLAKVREQARFHRRQRRDCDQDVPLPEPSRVEAGGDFDLVAPEPSPAEAAAFADQLEHLLASFDDDERRLVDLKLQQCTNLEAAARLGCSERTVQRLLKRVQARLERAFGDV